MQLTAIMSGTSSKWLDLLRSKYRSYGMKQKETFGVLLPTVDAQYYHQYKYIRSDIFYIFIVRLMTLRLYSQMLWWFISGQVKNMNKEAILAKFEIKQKNFCERNEKTTKCSSQNLAEMSTRYLPWYSFLPIVWKSWEPQPLEAFRAYVGL